MLKHYWTHNRKAWNVSTFLDCSVWQSFLHGFEILIMLPLDDFVGQERLDSNREVGVWAIGGFVHLIIRGLPHPTEEWCSVWFWAMHFDQSWHRHFDRTVLMSLLHTCRGELLKRLLCWILPDDLFFFIHMSLMYPNFSWWRIFFFLAEQPARLTDYSVGLTAPCSEELFRSTVWWNLHCTFPFCLERRSQTTQFDWFMCLWRLDKHSLVMLRVDKLWHR